MVVKDAIVTEDMVKDLKVGDTFTGFLVIRKKELREYERGKYLRLELGDRSGRIDGVVWEKAESIFPSLLIGEVVKVNAYVAQYREMIQLRVDQIQIASRGEYDLNQLVAASEKSPEELLDGFKAAVNTITNPHLRNLLDLIYSDERLMRLYAEAPAAKLWHHAYRGGLLEHTLQVVAICDFAARLYPEVDRDLLITGALLHDIGKVVQYRLTTLVDYTDEGRLVGHINSGDQIVTEKIKQTPGLPENLALRLRHLIISHQGTQELGSPVVPMTPEAFVLHYADEMDAKLGAVSRIVTSEKSQGKTWSDWVRLLNRYIYLGSEVASETGDAQPPGE